MIKRLETNGAPPCHQGEVEVSVDARLEAGSDGALRATGLLTFATARELWPQGLSRIDGVTRGGELVVDLSGITRSDSAGLALLVAWHAHAGEAGVQLAYRGLPAELRALAAISGAAALL